MHLTNSLTVMWQVMLNGWLSLWLGTPHSYHYAITKNWTPRNTQNHHILRFPFVPSLTSNLLVGGLGVQYLLNNPPQSKALSYCMWCWDKENSCRTKQTTLDDVKQEIRDFFTAVPSGLLKIKCRVSVVHSCKRVFKIVGPTMESDTKWG